ncbi:RNA-directed DNA polymerase (reverse transcriptase) [Euphorbia peplus]|nr:RNA-directed DNA polymerase (reverse transcriptase) [Euphorbia peplus]
MHTKKQGKGQMLIKIDLEKAYDRLDWNFIEDTLQCAGFNQTWSKNIMNCISSPKLSIIWNGRTLEQFVSSRGIRQGDSISPYIFVLCMDRLSHLINAEVDKGNWKPIKISQRGPLLSHLFFADDLILFAEASLDQISIIKSVLDTFCACSGQRTNLAKSSIYFSKNVDSELAKNLSAISGIPITDNLGMYLGMSIIHGRLNKTSFHHILGRVNSRLLTGKRKLFL